MSNIKENSDQFDKSRIKIDNETKSGNATGTELTRLKARKEDDIENWTTQDEIKLNKLKGGVKKKENEIDRHKRLQMDAGTQNAFKKTHKKDGNKSVGDPGTDRGLEIQKVGKNGEHSKVSDNIKYDRVQTYESFGEEIDSMRYLIEYMNNNNKNII